MVAPPVARGLYRHLSLVGMCTSVLGDKLRAFATTLQRLSREYGPDGTTAGRRHRSRCIVQRRRAAASRLSETRGRQQTEIGRLAEGSEMNRPILIKVLDASYCIGPYFRRVHALGRPRALFEKIVSDAQQGV
jgi:hypothetical protein